MVERLAQQGTVRDEKVRQASKRLGALAEQLFDLFRPELSRIACFEFGLVFVVVIARNTWLFVFHDFRHFDTFTDNFTRALNLVVG